MKAKGSISIFLAVLAAAVAVAAAEVDLNWFTFSNGGSLSAGGGFELSGTIGQSAAGVMHGGLVTLTGGFRFQIPPGDFEEDGGVDLRDVAWFALCVAGPVGEPPMFECRRFDVNRDGAVDLADFSTIQTNFTGS